MALEGCSVVSSPLPDRMQAAFSGLPEPLAAPIPLSSLLFLGCQGYQCRLILVSNVISVPAADLQYALLFIKPLFRQVSSLPHGVPALACHIPPADLSQSPRLPAPSA